jgi:hypothetical protein
VSKASPNQGIKLSLENSLAAFLVTWLIVGLICGEGDAWKRQMQMSNVTP